MRKLMLVLVLGLVSAAAGAQVASRGNLYISGKNQQGFDVFMVVCHRHTCIGPHGKKLGSVKNVAQQLPYVPAVAITKYGYWCWTVCRDNEGNIIGRPSPNYRNIYKKP